MALPSIGGGRQYGDGNTNEIVLITQPAPATIAAGATATITAAQIVTGIILASPGGTASAYTLPTGTLMDATFVNANVDSGIDFSVTNIDGSGSGVITMTAGTGWTLVGLATIAATAGTSAHFRARRTAAATWTLYRIS